MAQWDITVPAGSGVGGAGTGSSAITEPGDFDGATINSVTVLSAPSVNNDDGTKDDTIGIRWRIETSTGTAVFGDYTSDATTACYATLADASLSATVTAGTARSPNPSTAVAADWDNIAYNANYSASKKNDGETVSWSAFTLRVDYTPAAAGNTSQPPTGTLSLSKTAPSAITSDNKFAKTGDVYNADGNDRIYIHAIDYYRKSGTRGGYNDWTDLWDDSTAASGAYLQADTATGIGLYGEGPYVDYRIKINTAGNYNLRARVDGGTGSVNDSVFWAIIDDDDGDVYKTSTASFNWTRDTVWHWTGDSGSDMNSVPVGTHTLRIFRRERSVTVDQFYLSLVSDTTGAPTGIETPSTKSSTGQGNLTLSKTAPTVDDGASAGEQANIPSGSLSLSKTAPSAVATENKWAQPPSGALALSKTAPSAIATENKWAQPPSGALALSKTAPSAVATENKWAQPPSGALALSKTAPSAVATENKWAQPPSGALSLTGNAPTADDGAAAGEQANVPSGTLSLSKTAPSAVATENKWAQPPSGALSLSKTAPTAVATEDRWAQPPAGSLSLTGNTPQATATENKWAQTPSGALSLSKTAPAAVATENRWAQPPAGSLSLTGNAPTVDDGAVAGEQAEIPSGSLSLSKTAPTVVAEENRWSSVAQGALSLTGGAPTISYTEARWSDIPTGPLSLSKTAPSAVTTENRWAEPPTGTLALSGSVPSAVTTELRWSDIPAGVLTLSGGAPAVDNGDAPVGGGGSAKRHTGPFMTGFAS